MADDVKLTVQFEGEVSSLIEFPAEGLTVSVPFTQVGVDLFRLDGVPLGVDCVGYRDIVEAEPVEGGSLRFRRVVERSGWRTYDYILSPGRIDSEWGQSLLRELEAQGGYWEGSSGACSSSVCRQTWIWTLHRGWAGRN